MCRRLLTNAVFTHIVSIIEEGCAVHDRDLKQGLDLGFVRAAFE